MACTGVKMLAVKDITLWTSPEPRLASIQPWQRELHACRSKADFNNFSKTSSSKSTFELCMSLPGSTVKLADIIDIGWILLLFSHSQAC